MPYFEDARPQISVRLYKTISRATIDGQSAVSSRYQGKDEFIDLTPFLGDNSRVTTTKSVREPAGAFSITFGDLPQKDGIFRPALESIYGLVEPMDLIEIRMWSGIGSWPAGKPYPIKMRGFVSKVSRGAAMSGNGTPTRQVVISGQDYGKIWQTYQVLYLRAYDGSQPYLTAYNMFEKFGVQATNTLKASEFIKLLVEKILNPHLDGFMPKNTPMPRSVKTDKFIAVKRGVINNSYQSREGSLYDIAKFYGDVGPWNELYLEDYEDGVHVVYRPIPAMHISKPKGSSRQLIQDDAPEPVYGDIPDGRIRDMQTERSDENVANFYWVNNSKYSIIDDIYRKLMALEGKTVSTGDYPNSATKYYGVRPMYAETQQEGDSTTSGTSGQPKEQQEKRSADVEAWIDYRRRCLMEMNKDNVVFESGRATLKGGPMRRNGTEHLRAGDYANFKLGTMEYSAYVVQISDDFVPNQLYTTTINFERGLGFVTRASMEGGRQSPWLAEQATRGVL